MCAGVAPAVVDVKKRNPFSNAQVGPDGRLERK
jgi:hypothetical protein